MVVAHPSNGFVHMRVGCRQRPKHEGENRNGGREPAPHYQAMVDASTADVKRLRWV